MSSFSLSRRRTVTVVSRGPRLYFESSRVFGSTWLLRLLIGYPSNDNQSGTVKTKSTTPRTRYLLLTNQVRTHGNNWLWTVDKKRHFSTLINHTFLRVDSWNRSPHTPLCCYYPFFHLFHLVISLALTANSVPSFQPLRVGKKNNCGRVRHWRWFSRNATSVLLPTTWIL